MATIDKTYVKNYSDLLEIRNWARDTYITDAAGTKHHLLDWVNDTTEEEFNKYYQGGECVVWNTPTWIDVFLIRNCPIKLVQNRLKEQYGTEYENIKNYTSIYDSYKRNGLGKNIRFNIVDKPDFNIICTGWSVDIEDVGWWYSNESNSWHHCYELCNTDCSHAHICGKLTPRKIYRLLRKWNLPANLTIRFSGYYVGQDWIIKTK